MEAAIMAKISNMQVSVSSSSSSAAAAAKKKKKKKKTSIDDESRDGNYQKVAENLEIRPGGMLVQMRDSNNSDHHHHQNSDHMISSPTIKVKVKYGSSYHHVHITSHATFGELKKLLAEKTGLHPQDQKLIFKNKERDSKAYLDVARIKDGSKIVLIEDTLSRDKRCLEMLKNANFEKNFKFLELLNSEVAKLFDQVESLNGRVFQGGKVAENEVDNLIEMLMRKLVQLDGIEAVGDLRLQRRDMVKKVQKKIESLDQMKLNCIKFNNKVPLKEKVRSSNGINSMALLQNGNKKVEEGRGDQTESVVMTANWETFD